LYVEGGKVQLNLSKRWLDDALRVETEAKLEPGCWHHVAATYDGSRVADGVRIYIDGKPAKLKILLDDLNQTFHTEEPLRIGAAGGRRDQVAEPLPTTMVMEEMPARRDTFVLIRGAYDRPGERVTPGVPAALLPLPAGAPPNRLGFARWLVDPANPLSARVTVNRFWQMYFGTGLVKTVED